MTTSPIGRKGKQFIGRHMDSRPQHKTFSVITRHIRRTYSSSSFTPRVVQRGYRVKRKYNWVLETFSRHRRSTVNVLWVCPEGGLNVSYALVSCLGKLQHFWQSEMSFACDRLLCTVCQLDVYRPVFDHFKRRSQRNHSLLCRNCWESTPGVLYVPVWWRKYANQ